MSDGFEMKLLFDRMFMISKQHISNQHEWDADLCQQTGMISILRIEGDE